MTLARKGGGVPGRHMTRSLWRRIGEKKQLEPRGTEGGAGSSSSTLETFATRAANCWSAAPEKVGESDAATCPPNFTAGEEL